MRFDIPLDQLEVSLDIPWKESQQPYHTIDIYFDVVPSTGTLNLFVDEGNQELIPLAGGTHRLLSMGGFRLAQGGKMDKLVLQFASVTGGAGAYVIINSYNAWPQPQFPDGAFEGTRALTTQPYIEANIKRGLQFEVSSLNPTLLAAANQDTIFITGSKPVIVKARQVSFNGAHLTARVYRGSAYTGGTPIGYFNLNDQDPAAGTVSILGGATVSDPGTEFGAPTFMVGTDGVGNSIVGTFATTGSERILRANTTYLLRLTNTDSVTQRVAAYLTWYEGETDL
jgi:hypothetical protein